MARSRQPSDKEVARMGGQLVRVLETGYVTRSEAFKFAFIKGMITGFGAFLGGTLLIALLIWILSLFNDVPLIGRFVEMVQESVRSTDQ